MRFEAGDDVIIVGPDAIGDKFYIGQAGEILSNYVYGGEIFYMVELGDIIKGFPVDSIRLSEEDMFSNVLEFKQINNPVVGIKHIITIRDKDHILNTAEVKHLKNLLEVIL